MAVHDQSEMVFRSLEGQSTLPWQPIFVAGGTAGWAKIAEVAKMLFTMLENVSLCDTSRLQC